MTTDFSFRDDVLDVRDLIERFEELRDEGIQKKIEAWGEWYETDEGKEYIELEKILDELCGNGGDEKWEGNWYPVTLIHEDYFTEYTKELLIDCGYLPKDLPSWIEIDWESTADNCKVDYTTIDIGDETYYYR